jgi:hypothetical protein
LRFLGWRAPRPGRQAEDDQGGTDSLIGFHGPILHESSAFDLAKIAATKHVGPNPSTDGFGPGASAVRLRSPSLSNAEGTALSLSKGRAPLQNAVP